MSPHLDGGLDLPILIAMMVVALLLRSALGASRAGVRSVLPPLGELADTTRTVLGLVLGVGGLLLLLTVLSLR